jgi:AcrR family transcriptional regulator
MIYQYFGGKEELYLAVLLDADSDLAQKFPAVEQMSPAEAVRSAAGALIDYCAGHPDYVSLMLWEAVSGWRNYNQLASRATDAAIWRLVRTVERGIAEGIFRPELDPLLAVNATIAQIIMYSSIYPRLHSAEQTIPGLMTVREGLIDLVFYSLLKR